MVIHITWGLKQELTNTYCIVIKVTPSAQGWCEWGTWAMVGMDPYMVALYILNPISCVTYNHACMLACA